MIKLKSKETKDGRLKVSGKGNGTLAEMLGMIFTLMDEIPQKYDMNRGRLLEIINHHYDYYNKERRS